jgi:hypothetical protein
MARRLKGKLTYKSALALIPPRSITEPIQAVRREHDRHFARGPPHINLLNLFRTLPLKLAKQELENPPPKLKEDIWRRTQQNTKSIKPFTISLNTGPPGKLRGKSVWLRPTTLQAMRKVQELQAALQLEFEEFGGGNKGLSRPRLLLGQANSDDEAKLLKEKFRSSVANSVTSNQDASVTLVWHADRVVPSVKLDWHVDRVFVIEFKGGDGNFQVVGSIALGSMGSIGQFLTQTERRSMVKSLLHGQK